MSWRPAPTWISRPRSVTAALARHRPWAVINAAGYVRVADAEGDPERCFRENAEGALILAQACADLGIPFITFSSDLVFDGRLGRPYRESDPVTPQIRVRGEQGEGRGRGSGGLQTGPWSCAPAPSSVPGTVINSPRPCCATSRRDARSWPAPTGCRQPTFPTSCTRCSISSSTAERVSGTWSIREACPGWTLPG